MPYSSDSHLDKLLAADAPDAAGSRALSVSAAMGMAKGALEAVTVTIVGEVSEVSVKPGYKAAYFTIKDKSASLPCMMWNNRYKASGVNLQLGQLVQVTGRFTLYAAKGRMNFDVFSLSLAGEGDLRLQVANLAKKLQAEGLTDASRKLSVPQFPQTIGLVTSPRGAAVHDVLRTLRRRFPLAQVYLAGVPVEGANAPAAIIEGMKCVYDAGAEVILVVRGGGSFEDLMPFNDERLARTIAKCPVPVVTGIGHEPDTSIADMVADLRTSTPTAAAEAVSPAPEALQGFIEGAAQGLVAALTRTLSRAAERVTAVSSRPVFRDDMYLTGQAAQEIDAKLLRLTRAIPLGLARDAQALARAEERMGACLPKATGAKRDALAATEARLAREGAALTARFENEFSLKAARLDDLSPLKTLSRGFAIARDAEGRIVKDASLMQAGDALDVTLSNGVLTCEVKGVDVSTDSIFSAAGKAAADGC